MRPKSAPHLAEIIPAKRGEEFRQTMHEHVDAICDFLLEEGGIAGFVIAGWDFQAGWSCGRKHHKDSPVSASLSPSFVADILREQNATNAARDVFEGNV